MLLETPLHEDTAVVCCSRKQFERDENTGRGHSCACERLGSALSTVCVRMKCPQGRESDFISLCRCTQVKNRYESCGGSHVPQKPLSKSRNSRKPQENTPREQALLPPRQDVALHDQTPSLIPDLHHCVLVLGKHVTLKFCSVLPNNPRSIQCVLKTTEPTCCYFVHRIARTLRRSHRGRRPG